MDLSTEAPRVRKTERAFSVRTHDHDDRDAVVQAFALSTPYHAAQALGLELGPHASPRRRSRDGWAWNCLVLKEDLDAWYEAGAAAGYDVSEAPAECVKPGHYGDGHWAGVDLAADPRREGFVYWIDLEACIHVSGDPDAFVARLYSLRNNVAVLGRLRRYLPDHDTTLAAHHVGHAWTKKRPQPVTPATGQVDGSVGDGLRVLAQRAIAPDVLTGQRGRMRGWPLPCPRVAGRQSWAGCGRCAT